MERVLVALGGNAMTAADGSAAPDQQRRAIETAMRRVADLIEAGHELILTHGNGPQVGNLLLKNQIASSVVPPVPLDWCGAQTQATIGMMIMNALETELGGRGVPRPVTAIVSRTLVDLADPAFESPVKPIGRYFSAQEAERFVSRGETWRSFGPRGWRRVVPSPEPLEILDAPTAHALLTAGFVVVASGGGGIPVVRADGGDGARAALRGVEAVVDKDLAAALLGRTLEATTLVIATDVEHAMIDYGTPEQRALGRTTPAELRRHAADGQFASGSMGPKVEAAARFVEGGGRRAVITTLDLIAEAVAGKAGTIVEG